MLIDTHAHLFKEKFDDEQIDEIVKSLGKNNLEKVILASSRMEDCEGNLMMTQKYDNLFCTIGIHPENIEELTQENLKKIENLAKDKKVVAIGEIGLDYHYDGFDKHKQIEGFLKQVELSNKLKLPFVIHLRDAYADMLEILKKNKHLLKFGFVVHCYSGSVDYAKQLLELGAYFSFTGVITFKNARKAVEVINFLPLDRIMIETDCPYLAPEPIRGTINQPKNVNFVFNKICEIKKIDKDVLDKILRENVRNFYKI